MTECFFCNNSGGKILYTEKLYRIVLVNEEMYPGLLRVIANCHIKECSDLALEDNLSIYRAVIKCEQILRRFLAPDKINLATLGNLTPHLHWHIIPRFKDDLHFPNSIWGELTHPNYQVSDKLLKQVTEMSQQIMTNF